MQPPSLLPAPPMPSIDPSMGPLGIPGPSAPLPPPAAPEPDIPKPKNIDFGSDSERTKWGRTLTDWIETGNGQKGDIESGWWREVEQFYRNEAPEPPKKNMVAWHQPLLQQRIDGLSAQMVNVVGRQDPIMVCDLANQDLANRRQQFLHKILMAAQIKLKLRSLATHAGNLNKGYLKVAPKEEEGAAGIYGAKGSRDRAGVEITCIPPDDMVVFPAVVDGFDTAVFVGNRIKRRVAVIEARQASGEYYESVVLPTGSGGSEPDPTGAKARSDTTVAIMAQDNKQALLTLWDGIALMDIGDQGIEKLYRVTVLEETQELLACELYPFRYRWYFETGLIPDDRNYYGASSVGRNLYSLQDSYNKCGSALITAGFTVAMPPIAGPPLESGEKFSQYQIGEYIGIEGGEGQPFSPNIQPQLQPLVNEQQRIEHLADQVARVSQNTLGAQTSGATTATEQSIVASGVATGIEDFIEMFVAFMPGMAEHVEEIALSQYSQLAQYYTRPLVAPQNPMTGDPNGGNPLEGGMPGPMPPMATPVGPDIQVPLLTADELRIPTCWAVNGTSPAHTPQAKLQAVAQFAQMAQDEGYGIDKYELAKTGLANSSLGGTKNVQITKEELMAHQQAAMQHLPPDLPKIAISYDSLPLDGKIQAAALANIHLDPQVLMAHDLGVQPGNGQPAPPGQAPSDLNPASSDLNPGGPLVAAAQPLPPNQVPPGPSG